MGIEVLGGKKTSKIEKEIWERTEIVETFDPKTMWEEFKVMSPFAQSDWVRKNPVETVKMLWHLQEKLGEQLRYPR